jgi:light-regulated signal transduction histidine kinase (bacteriophytochrome)
MSSFNIFNVEFLVNSIYNDKRFGHLIYSIKKGLVIEMEGNMFGIENERRSFTSSSSIGGIEFLKSKIDFLSSEQNAPFLSSFFIELIERIKNTLSSIKGYAQLSRGKFSDREFGDYFYRAVTGDVEKMDMVLNGLVNYVKLNTPIQKTDTVHHFIEEVLRKHQAKLDEKGIKLFKKFEKGLPETIVPDEQLRYILSSVLQYAIGSMPSNGSIGLSTRSLIVEKEVGQDLVLFQKDSRYIEISVVLVGYRKPTEQGMGAQTLRKEEPLDLILRFVKEVVQRNQGMMRIEADEKKAKTFIFLRLPVERRKVVYYQSLN